MNKRNKLLDAIIPPNYPRPDELRCSGRTTAIALEVIAWCIQNPGQKRMLVDHHQSTIANRHLAYLTRSILNKLLLDHMEIHEKHDGHYLVFNLWREEG
jgi:hypothetical protein